MCLAKASALQASAVIVFAERHALTPWTAWFQGNKHIYANGGQAAISRSKSYMQAHEPPARPQGLEELLHLLAAQQVATRTEDEGEEREEGEPDAQRQADNQAYTQSTSHKTNIYLICLSEVRPM